MRSISMNPFLQRPHPSPVRSGGEKLPSSAGAGGIFEKLNSLKKDDYILLGIIAVLFFEGSDDYILLTALGYLFLMGIL